MFRVDPGEMELSEEFIAELEQEQQMEQPAAAQPGATTPTGEQPVQAQPSQPATAVEQQFPWEQGYDIGDAARQVAEGALSVPAGLADFGVDLLNILPSKEIDGIENPFRPGGKVQKLPEFQTKHLQALREIASVVAPTIILSKLGIQAGAAAHSRVGWSLGNNAFVKAAGTLGVESAASVAVGAVSSQYTEDNITGMLKQNFPKTWDFIPDSLATLKDDPPDLKRKKNIYEELGMGPFTALAEGVVKFTGAMVDEARSLLKSNRLVGETPQAKAWLEANAPKPLFFNTPKPPPP